MSRLAHANTALRRDTALLHPEDHHQDHEQHPRRQPLLPTG
ncbi:hypothetical protein [Streptomyces sp. NPDC006925]